MRVPRKLRATVLAATAIAAIGLTAGEAMASVSLSFVGRAISGSGLAGSEIAAYSPSTKRLFVTNGATKKIDIFNVDNPAKPTLTKSVTLNGLGDLQSVATNGSLVAVAAYTDATDGKYLPGRVFLMDTNGTVDARAPQGVAVGALPDSIHFAPDGKTVVVANEGEPKNYCQTSGEFVDANDPKGSVSIIDTSAATLTATTLEFTAFNAQAAAIRSAGARIFGPGADVDQDLEPEYIAISADSKTAFVTLQENNAVAEIDLATKSITRIMGLGYKDYSIAGQGLDASNEDSATDSNSGSPAVSIRNWPIKGMYLPDAIATYTGADGTRYFVTGNEGDAREWPCLLGGTDPTVLQAEDGRKVKDLTVSASVFSSAPWTKTRLEFDSNLGALDAITRFFPTTATTMATYGGSSFAGTLNGNGNGAELSEVYALGARSISIFKAPTGTGVGSAVLVSDTGDTIEQKIAEALPALRFNTSWQDDSTSGTFGQVRAQDQRSPKKGPEPEGLAIGTAFGKTMAFVGLERVGGVMAFDISNPAAPQYLAYVNSATFDGNFNTGKATAAAGDAGPEGVLFVRASDSPTGKPALIVSYEYSGTTAIYNLNGTAVKPGAPTGVSAKADGRSAIVSWTAPKEDGGGAITSYVVTSKPGGYTCTADATASCRVDALPANRKYTFTVKTRNIAGESPASDATAEITTGSFKPKVPNGVTLRAGATSIRVMWKRSPDNGGVKIDNYIATAKPGGKTCSSTARSCVIEGLTPGKKYSVKLVAVNAVGNSAAVGTDRVLVGFVQGAKTIAQDSPVALRWLVRTHSPGKVVGSVTSGDCSIASGRVVATGTVGSTCSVKVTVGRAAGFASMTRVVDLEVRAPRDYKDIFARNRTR